MNLDLLREMLKRHEGLRLKPYPCSADVLTIGYGWNLSNILPEDIASYLRVTGEITRTMAERLLNISIETATRQCWSIFPRFGGFTEKRQMALIDFVFNVGAGGTLKFKKALAAIETGDWEKAADEFQDSKWFKQVGDRGPEIVNMIREG
ncbi:MAG: glycoside hydrolase family protein [Dehalococcoidia bacterium]